MKGYKEIYKNVIELDTYEDLDFDFAEETIYDLISIYGRKGGCSAITTKAENGDILVGRNMDLYICDYPTYIVRTNVKELYKTIGITMIYKEPFVDYKTFKRDGLDDTVIKMLPFVLTDVLNEKGLYIETNMRCAEKDEHGKGKYLSPYKESNKKHKLPLPMLNQFIATHCETIDEALDYIKDFELYSDTFDDSWGYGLLMVDTSGRSGVLELANNKVYWSEGAKAQTNFYIDEGLRSKQRYQSGAGRYDWMIDHIKDVKDEKDLKALMESICYTKMYSEDTPFDTSTEYVDDEKGFDVDFVMDKKNEAELVAKRARIRKKLAEKKREGITVSDGIWETTFENIVNLKKKEMNLRFFENDDMTLKLKFNT